MRKTLLEDGALLKAVREMECGLVDADLGGNVLEEKVYKKRIPYRAGGKAEVRVLSWLPVKPESSFFFMVLKKTIRTTSQITSWLT